MKNKVAAVLGVIVALTALTALPANAAASNVVVSPTTAVARTGTVNVTLANIPAGQGVYVMFCAKPNNAGRPTSCFGRGVWASTDTTALGQGAVSATNPISLPVAASFTPQGGSAVDCDLNVCGVFVRRDHMGPTDTSLDQFVPVAFVSAVPSSISVKATSGRILVSISGHKGQTIDVFVAGRKVSRQLLADQVSFYVGNGGNSAAKVVIKQGTSKLFNRVLSLKK